VTNAAGTTAGPVPEGARAPDLRVTGERIEALLEAASTGGPVARERAEELVRLVVDLYGAGLERLLEIVHEAGRLDDDLLDRLAADDLVASLLAVHGLHPDDVETRVLRALDGVRPYLGSHGGDVELLGVTDDGVVRLRMLGSCDGCPSSSVTLTLAVETAIHAAAPELRGIEVEEPAAGAGASVIPVSALRSRLDDDATSAGASWAAVEGFGGLSTGQTGAFSVSGMPVVGLRIGGDLFAYRDRCPGCGSSLVDGAVERLLGGRAGDAVLRCPRCSAHFDVRRAGRGLDGTDHHLEPVPLLVTDGVVSLAVPGAVSA
jgi:Fe-S cluster biogenesis protein NfuA/nitrite reductase/ring-hydroxylating ferredoxin subunit